VSLSRTTTGDRAIWLFAKRQQATAVADSQMQSLLDYLPAHNTILIGLLYSPFYAAKSFFGLLLIKYQLQLIAILIAWCYNHRK
jgi:hypothetical protein